MKPSQKGCRLEYTAADSFPATGSQVGQLRQRAQGQHLQELLRKAQALQPPRALEGPKGGGGQQTLQCLGRALFGACRGQKGNVGHLQQPGAPALFLPSSSPARGKRRQTAAALKLSSAGGVAMGRGQPLPGAESEALLDHGEVAAEHNSPGKAGASATQQGSLLALQKGPQREHGDRGGRFVGPETSWEEHLLPERKGGSWQYLARPQAGVCPLRKW